MDYVQYLLDEVATVLKTLIIPGGEWSLKLRCSSIQQSTKVQFSVHQWSINGQSVHQSIRWKTWAHRVPSELHSSTAWAVRFGRSALVRQFLDTFKACQVSCHGAMSLDSWWIVWGKSLNEGKTMENSWNLWCSQRMSKTSKKLCHSSSHTAFGMVIFCSEIFT